ncbi:unnamed protein product [Spirodela intermedia]|uniref:alpha,alpha-trehalose-phosphate synthase (UDP-forming) n=1 Tax=Spirodela intermedia TaxID=51605 RepID=A0A7I8J888_SPIIN|nr:unnamed protein product [Spirodela intermedia]CAA6665653.1 unnamed protein product [Spirodela intermedia]
MMSRSYTNLLDLASGNFPAAGGGGRRRLPRVMTVPAIVSELDDEQANSVSSDAASSSSAGTDRMIIVANQLPVDAERRRDGGGWSFSWDEESLLLQLKDGLPEDTTVIYVGSLRVAVDPGEQESVSQALLEGFRCVPTFLPDAIFSKFYHGFCKQQLWPLFHYMLPVAAARGGRFDRSLWEAYLAANKIYSQKVIEVINPEEDYVWVHDYHLMAVPTFLRRRFNRLRMGFFLHSPFPSSEIYRALPVREEILKALLNSDLIGFHTFDYARHFLSCCSRLLGLEYQSRRGYIGLEYFGRTVGIKIMPVGVHIGKLESALKLTGDERGTVLLGVDDLDVFKGINLKLMAFEQLLKTHHGWRGRAVLVQIANPARGRGRELEGIQGEIAQTCRRINEAFGGEGYRPVVYIDRHVSLVERLAFYTIAECLIVTAVRDGMNLTPYEYIVCRQGVAARFIGCSPSLSGAIRINPWCVESTADAMREVIAMSDAEKQLRHENHYRYDLERSCRDHFKKKCWGIGLGFGFRVVALDPSFRKLDIAGLVSAYRRTRNRAILLDYDGTVMPQATINKTPGKEVTSIMNELSGDENNVVFIVSGRGTESLGEWFSPCPKLGIAAEHGYFMRRSRDEGWETQGQITDSGWIRIAEPVLKLYTEATDGSSIETKVCGLVWHHRDADPNFGSSQAKELQGHLESVLANESVEVKRGQFIVEVKPQGISKGLAAEKILSSMRGGGRQADFVLCIGDDRSDEEMFQSIDSITAGAVSSGGTIFACTVGQKPSKAKYYLDDTTEVLALLRALAEASGNPPSSSLPDDEASSSSPPES